MMTPPLLKIFSIALLWLPQMWEQGNLTVEVTNINDINGQLVIAIYDKKENFPLKGKEYRKYTAKVDGASVTCSIDNLPYGNYSIVLFQDKNMDGKCNLNFIGIPTEGYGFSNNIKPRLSAPSFDDTKFSFTTNHKTVSINLIQ